MNYTIQTNSIKMWAEDDRPREKLMLKGSKALSDSELIAILIGSGTKELSAIDVAKELLKDANHDLHAFSKKTIQDFQKIKGIGEAKAITIAAALELGRRRKEAQIPVRPRLLSSSDTYEYLRPFYQDEITENFFITLLNRANYVIETIQVSKGGTTSTIVDGKIIFKIALEKNAVGIILSHNHPSNTKSPSEHDIRITKKLVDFGRMIELPIIEHLIYAEDGYYSFADGGRI